MLIGELASGCRAVSNAVISVLKKRRLSEITLDVCRALELRCGMQKLIEHKTVSKAAGRLGVHFYLRHLVGQVTQDVSSVNHTTDPLTTWLQKKVELRSFGQTKLVQLCKGS